MRTVAVPAVLAGLALLAACGGAVPVADPEPVAVDARAYFDDYRESEMETSGRASRRASPPT